MRKRVLAALILAVFCLSGVWANGSKDAAGSDEKTIVVMPKLVGIPYFNASETGAIQAGKDLGVNVIYTGPTTPDAAEQVRMLEDLISKGVDAICVAPNDAAALTPVLMKAKKAGIAVLDWDTPADASVVDLSVHQIDDQEYGQHIWDLLVQEMGESGDYAIITGGLSAANLNTWIDAGLAYAKSKYPGLNLVTDKVPSDEKQQMAYQKTLDLIKAYPNLKGVVGVSTPAPLGAAQAVQEKGLKDRIAVVGTSLPTDSGPYLDDGSLRVGTLWDPSKLGYLTVVLAYNLLNGEKPVDGQNIENVGKISVWKDGRTVVMGPPADFTKENHASFSF
ncbi:autoinducer 2 ABC transporter substrate-binding protein [Marispirochaeta sp.]|uniref:autoinducer 2 ABC transporter substrate-binding protein n=1 Tax=Marispirochaeta sp. TaxID=2038653 RepID=UPI0029C85764|nr:autoinducer 2 ABC transporter substrate-binding protein [Marispirochaeta sp.]